MASNHTPCDDGVCGADGEQGRATLIWQQPMCSPFVQQMPGGNVVVNDSVNVASQLSGDILYNGGASLHPSVPSNVCYSAGHSETYSVLPVGHGNFLKVYHCTDTDSHLQQTQHQQQLMHQHQSVHQQISPTFNSYELFSSNTIVPPPQQKTLMPHSHIGNPEQSSVVFVESSGIQCGPETFNNSELFCTNNIVPPNDANSPSTSTNMIINKLVNNWSPNLTGGAYSQFGNGVMEQQMYATITPIQSNAQHHQPSQEPSFQNSISMRMQMDSNSTIITSIAPSVLVNSQPAVSVETSVESQIKQKQQTHQQLLQQHQSHLQQNTFQSAGTCVSTNGSFENRSSSSTSATILPETVTKKRIVAEVKPMRMTYSDVLSKFNNQQATIATSGSNAKNKSVSKSIKQHQQQQNTLSDRKIVVNNDDGRNSVINKRQDQTGHRQSITDESQMHNAFSKSGGDLKKKSPAHENKENIQQQHTALNCNKSTRKNVTISNGTQKSSTISKNSKHNGVNTNGGVSENRKRSQKRDFDSGLGGGETMKTQKANAYTNSPSVAGGLKEDKDSYYNVTAAKSGSNFERSSKTPSSSTPNNNGNGNHQTQSNNVNNKKTSNNRQPSSGMPSNSFKAYVSQRQQSYSYSSKRGGGQSHQQYHHRNPKYSNKYELAHKFLEYTIKILTWLFYLIYDIVVLGFSVGYERLSHYYTSAYAYAILLRNDLKNNSNKPSIWLKNYLRRIDARFKKTSKWAFWRRFYKKKPVEQAPEYVKTGRLPQTGDEAMYSLLNCKGKDAYSILGVPVDSSQEQIRKHYKKIAVLVHPDKNKQPGAEEAFKVLQRAFELIGEPENRQAYDQSLVEALNAEKAWSELHDLLSQLQSKITEAANTIRCSSCSLRHPRKMTDRPHYAARECASCKIRHSAREGDIWAETTLFGLRWKYLALMEGKVYDITEWANCQKGALSHLEPNSHIVQYRIVRGAQQQQQQQQQQNQQQQQQQQQQQHQPNSQQDKGRFKRGEPRRCEASLDEFLDNLYSGQNRHGQQNAGAATGSRRRSRRN